MENFFYNDTFYPNIEDFISDLFEDDNDIIINLPDNEIYECEGTDLEPVFNMDWEKMEDLLCSVYEERLSEDTTDRELDKIRKAITESFDFDKFKELLPKFYYPSGEKFTITKQDLLDSI